MNLFRKPALAFAGAGANAGATFDAAWAKTQSVSKGVVREVRKIPHHTYHGVKDAIEVLIVNLAFVGFALSLGIGGGMYVRHQNEVARAHAHQAFVAAEVHAIRHNADEVFTRPARLVSDLMKRRINSARPHRR